MMDTIRNQIGYLMTETRYDYLFNLIQSLPDRENIQSALRTCNLDVLTPEVVNTLQALIPHPSECYQINKLPNDVLSDPVIAFVYLLHQIPNCADYIDSISYIHSFNKRLPDIQKAISDFSSSLQELQNSPAITQLMTVILMTVNYGRKKKGSETVNWIPVYFLTILSSAEEGTEEYILMMSIVSSIRAYCSQELELLDKLISNLSTIHWRQTCEEIANYSNKCDYFTKFVLSRECKYKLSEVKQSIQLLEASLIKANECYNNALYYFSEEDDKDYSPDSFISHFVRFYSRLTQLKESHSAGEQISQTNETPEDELIEILSADSDQDYYSYSDSA